MMKHSLHFCLVLLALPAWSLPALSTGHDPRARFRLAAAEQQFESTPAPEVTLEKPQNLERVAPPPPTEEVPPAEAPEAEPPEAEQPVPQWFKDAQESIGVAMDEGAGAADESEGALSGEGEPRARGLGQNVVQSFVALLIVLALILLCVYLLKRFGKQTPLLAGSGLGTVLGRIYLSPKASLHFIKVRNTVLVVGVTPAGMSSIARLDASLFEDASGQSANSPAPNAPGSFLAHLKSSRQTGTPKDADSEDDEIAALRGDLARLQQYLQETSRELGE
ncbi:MAG: flagellar biosynthetic protein FliO [Candidatus Hydrogenedentes bacterium]|nr:flagellar biosynthetic protein FliO [Candidatus Hydrogenedentota bacterium]